MRPDVALAGILTTAAAYWLWFGLTQRSIVGDDGISLLAARGVLEHGYPRLPSGFVYTRAYVPAYMLAGSLGLIGWNDLGVMLPSLVMALVSMWITARMGAEMLGRPLVGVAAAAALGMLQVQTFYATSPRMYMPLQAFTVMAAYCAWRGFVQGAAGFKLLAMLAIAGAILSHQQGGALLVAVPFAVLAARAMQGAARPPMRTSAVAAATLLLCASFYVARLHQPAGSMPAIAAHSGIDPDHAGLNVNLVLWLRHALVAESTLPLGILVVPWLIWLLVKAIRAPGVAPHQGLVFIAGMFIVGAVATAANINHPRSRFWLMLLPLHVLLVSRAAAGAFEWVSAAAIPAARRHVRSLACAAWVLVVFGASATAYGAAVYGSVIGRAYGLPACRVARCSAEIAAEYMKLREIVEPGDVVVTTNPMVTYYYLPHVEGFLRERRDGDRFVPFESAVDEYFGIPLIDQVSKLEALRTSGRRVWVVLDYKAAWYISQTTLDFVVASFAPFFVSDSMAVYVNASTSAPEQPRTTFQRTRDTRRPALPEAAVVAEEDDK